ncbi:hypothetical protein [Wolbachia endosymbiont (group B) of Melanargia galathea]|uniref:hypothetical protein n=1 Tax=Wolbachia endosymbiont (group B) of Melanargia galathea TaxID=2954029 RepID=UPI00313B2C66
MVLQSCQKQISDLFSSDSSWVNPNQDYIKAAKYLSNLELISMQEKYYIICANRQDKLDWPNVIDPYCKNEIFIDEDFDEACENIICEDCNRDIFPNTYRKQRFHRLSVYLNSEKIMCWFESQLSNTNFMWHRVENGVYYIGGQGKFVNLIILDFCTNSTFLTIDRLRVNPTVLVILRKNTPSTLLDLPIVEMVDILCQRKTLIEVFQRAVERGIPELIPNTSIQILHTAYIPLKQIEPAKERKLLELQMVEGTICVNNIKIMNEKASTCINVFRVLFKQFLHDCEKELLPEKYTLLSIHQLEKLLNLDKETDPEHYIRKPINTIQRTIKTTLAKKLGLNIERNDVIETVGWPGSSRKDYGYRINPFTLVIKATR